MYVKYQFNSPSAAAAPRNDIELSKTLTNYTEILLLLSSHYLRYTSEIIVVSIRLASFDDKVSMDMTRNKVAALNDAPKLKQPSQEVSIQ